MHGSTLMMKPNTHYVLVHANIAKMRAPLDSPLMAGFVNNIDAIDSLAEQTPGFIAQPEPPDDGEIFPNDVLVNVSIWQDVKSLQNFTYGGEHKEVMERGSEWFEDSVPPRYVLYWVEEETIPTHKEINARLEHLREHGPSPVAFNFDKPFAPEELTAKPDKSPLDH